MRNIFTIVLLAVVLRITAAEPIQLLAIEPQYRGLWSVVGMNDDNGNFEYLDAPVDLYRVGPLTITGIGSVVHVASVTHVVDRHGRPGNLILASNSTDVFYVVTSPVDNGDGRLLCVLAHYVRDPDQGGRLLERARYMIVVSR